MNQHLVLRAMIKDGNIWRPTVRISFFCHNLLTRCCALHPVYQLSHSAVQSSWPTHTHTHTHTHTQNTVHGMYTVRSDVFGTAHFNHTYDKWVLIIPNALMQTDKPFVKQVGDKFLSDYCFVLWHAVRQLIESLRYKPEGRGFDSRWCHWNFSLT
jgi:hypothetical protein